MTMTEQSIAQPPARQDQKPRKTRIACYERVSTEEQAVHGYSISAQKEALNTYCKEHDYIIIGHYTDEGISGGKPASKRPAMNRLLRDVEHGLVDLVLFCKLDRWFRNVKEYFKVQDILDAHGVTWNAIQEDYETETASGRMVVTVMLSVAQNERERTSERIRAVFDYRAAKGEFLSGGHAVPFGYKVENKHLVKDPAREPAVNRLFEQILAGVPTGTAVRQVREEFDGLPSYTHMCRMVYNPHYAGIHKGQGGFCPQYITEAQHEIIQQRRGTRTPKYPETPYFFSGIICCPACGRKLATTRRIVKGVPYIYYFCVNGQLDKNCPFTGRFTETRLERALTAYLFKPGEFIMEDAKPARKPARTAGNASQIEKKMRRLAETYTDGLIERDEYKRKLADLSAQLDAARKAPRTRSAPPVLMGKENLQGDLQTVYNRFTRAEKRRFWQSVMLKVKFDSAYHIMDILYVDVSN